MRVPALHIGGWYDAFLSGLVRNFVELSRQSGQPQKLVIGPWYHIDWAPVDWPGNPTDGSAGWRAVDQWQLRWFDRFLKEDEETPTGSAVSVYVLGEGWREFDTWPPRIAQEQQLFLHSGGSANSSQGDGVLSSARPGDEPADVYVYDPLGVAPRAGGHSCCVPSAAPMGPACQSAAETAKTMLVYTTAPLERELVADRQRDGDAVRGELGGRHGLRGAPLRRRRVRLLAERAGGDCVGRAPGTARARHRRSRRARSTATRSSSARPGCAYASGSGCGSTSRARTSRSGIATSTAGARSGGSRRWRAAVATQVVLHDEEHPSCVTVHVVDA